MNEELFWSLMEQAYQPRNNLDPYDMLKNALEELSFEAILEFSETYGKYRDKLFTPAHLSAAFLVHEGALSNEDFAVYTEAVVAVPKDAYFSAKQEPDRLLDFPVYERVLKLDSYPFSALPSIIGQKKFGQEWHIESRKERWKRDPTDVDRIKFNGKKGLNVINPDLTNRLVPRLHQIYAPYCDW